jgi:L-asparaginase
MRRLIIHGGAGRVESSQTSERDWSEALGEIYREADFTLKRGGDARSAVLLAVRRLESEPLFNAGTGSKLQSDGQIRMSAAVMDGARALFSGVINVRHVEHPVDLAAALSGAQHHVLAGAEATEYARRLGFPFHDPLTKERLREYQQRLAGDAGTVGAVALDDEGSLFAATSTGGTGFETPGRVSDSATVAGTYATAAAGVSCTGRGEEIVNLAVAARVAVRVQDGTTLQESVARTVAEGNALNYRFGLIALDRQGNPHVGETSGTRVLFATGTEDGEIVTFLTPGTFAVIR